jgi:o-succinylbenzoate synthase
VIERRQGIVIIITDNNGMWGLGEISPLPGLHHETVNDIKKLLPAAKKYILSEEAGEQNNIWRSFPPSLRFALDAALISLQANRRKLSIADYINPKANKTVRVNALLLRGELSNWPKINQIKQAGYKSIKVKISAESLEDDAENLLRINDSFLGSVFFRIDANRSLSLSQALNFAKKIKEIKVDYFEEPLNDPQTLANFYEECGYPYAVDESLWQAELEHSKIPKGLKAVIIKPQLYGGIEEIEKIIKQFSAHSVQAVISDVFSSGVGLNTLTQLAAAYADPGTAMGLYTYHYLKKDILLGRLIFKNGSINVSDAWQKAYMLDEKKLIKLDI